LLNFGIMKIFLIILASFLLLTCSEPIHDKSPQCFNVTFADALPVKFWLNDCSTYNESIPQGVHYKCFCHEWGCDDEIRVQFTDEDYTKDYKIRVINNDDNVLGDFDFEKSYLIYDTTPFQSAVYDYTISVEEFCGDKIRLEVYENGSPETIIAKTDCLLISESITNPTLLFEYSNENNFNGLLYETLYSNLVSNLEDWTMIAGSDVNWTGIGTSSPQVYLGSSGAMASNRIKTDLALSTGKTYRVYYKVTCDHVFWKMRLRFRISGSATTPLPADITGTSGVNTGYIDVTVDVDTDDMTLECFKTTGGPILFEVNELHIYDLDAENISEVFQVRIPAILFHERFPSDREVAELSSSKIINLNSAMRAQKLLETDYLPYYFHQKIQLILMHDTVLIDGKYWTYNEAYEIQDGDRRWPEKKAKCWLNDRDFVQRNVI